MRDLKASGRILLISFDASDCGVVTIRLPFSSTGVERTSLSLASKKVNPVCPVDSQVNFFCDALVVQSNSWDRKLRYVPVRKSLAFFMLALL